MRTTTRWIALAALGLAAGCAYNPEPVPVTGNPSGLAALAGHWDGIYESEETGRHGTIVFDLEAGRDTALGDVIMTESRETSRRTGPPPSRVLRIRFVQAEGTVIRGEMEPYHDPVCGCLLKTTFEGFRCGDFIQGTFTTLHTYTNEVQRGVWRASRLK